MNYTAASSVAMMSIAAATAGAGSHNGNNIANPHQSLYPQQQQNDNNNNGINQRHAPACSQAPIGQGCCCCKVCMIGGCDVKVLPCGCCMHTRCCPLSETKRLTTCPVCNQSVRAIQLLPMPFDELDQAQAEAAQTELSAKRGKKRQNATIARLQPSRLSTGGVGSGMDSSGGGGGAGGGEVAEAADLRTGRWTTQETAYCDKLITLFEKGQLPIPNGIKLNDFLAGMLKSKQARLTKKMKNAKLSTRQYRHIAGYVDNVQEAKEFSQLETDFFASIKCNMERSEIKFHMQKEWRELFSSYCVSIGQSIDADDWLCSVEEMDRRASQQKDAARMARRKIMMGYALSEDAVDPQHGVFIDPKPPAALCGVHRQHRRASSPDIPNKRSRSSYIRSFSDHASPFVARVMSFVESRSVPFEHVDAWVPSLVPMDGMGAATPDESSNGQCRLCFAGCATSENQVPPSGGPLQPIPSEDHFDLVSFGLYSQKFSFDVGCGLPGRVYNSGIASWERGVTNAPRPQFERAGGAKQWGIQTVLGVPVASPNVGRIVVLFYSRFDREKDDGLVSRIMEELTKFAPAPQWKLVVEMGIPKEKPSDTQESIQERQLHALIKAHMPSDKNSPLSEYLPGFASLCLLLAEQEPSDRERDLLKSTLDSFHAYKSAGHQDVDVAWMTARDFMAISKSQIPQVTQTQPVAGVAAAPTAAAAAAAVIASNCEPGNSCCPPQNVTANARKINVEGVNVPLQNGGATVASLHNPNLPSISAPGHKTSNTSGLSLGGVDSNLQIQGHDLSALVGLSPGLAPMANGNQNDNLANFAPLGLSASQLSALLQSDASMNFNGNGNS